MSVAVLFLPGIMGSRLRFTNSDKFWDPDSSLRMLEWIPVPLINRVDKLARQIHRDEPAEVLEGDFPSDWDGISGAGWEGVAAGFYLPFLKAIHELGAPVFAIGYDWRQDVALLGARVAAQALDRIESAGADKILLVTHSMGGLVGRSALRQSPALQDRVAGVVHICQPVLGAVVAYRRFFTGAEFRTDGGLKDLPFIWILGDTADNFTRNTCGLPGAVQLLPAPAYVLPDGSAWNPQLPWENTPDRPPNLLAQGADDYVRSNLTLRFSELDGYFATDTEFRFDPERTVAVFGDGGLTDAAVTFNDSPIGEDRRELGDTVVPAPSGAALFGAAQTADWGGAPAPQARQWRMTGLTHSDAMLDDRVQAVVARALGTAQAGTS